MWILILILSINSQTGYQIVWSPAVSVTTAEFTSEANCKNAGKSVVAPYTYPETKIQYFCVKK